MYENIAEVKYIFSILMDGEVEFPLILWVLGGKKADDMGIVVKK